MARAWRVRLSVPAERDLREIVAWTSSRFGTAQSRAYRKTLSDAIDALNDGPTPLGSKRRSDLAEGMYGRRGARAG